MTRDEYAFGVDFAEGSPRVVAVRVGDGEIKYGCRWIGPFDTSNAQTWADFVAWAARALDAEGGYVHLFPVEGDAEAELREYVSEWCDE